MGVPGGLLTACRMGLNFSVSSKVLARRPPLVFPGMVSPLNAWDASAAPSHQPSGGITLIMPAPSDSISARRMSVSMSLNSASVGRSTRQLVRLIFHCFLGVRLLLQPGVFGLGASSTARSRDEPFHRATAQRLRNSQLAAAAYSARCAEVGANRLSFTEELAACNTLASKQSSKKRVIDAEAPGTLLTDSWTHPQGSRRSSTTAKAGERRRGGRGRRAHVVGSVGIAATAPPRDATASDQGELFCLWRGQGARPPTLSKATRARATKQLFAINIRARRNARPTTRAQRRP